MYADDFLLFSISITDMKAMIDLVYSELLASNLSLIIRKSVCMRIGLRHNVIDCSLLVNGMSLHFLVLFSYRVIVSIVNFRLTNIRLTNINFFVLSTVFLAGLAVNILQTSLFQ